MISIKKCIKLFGNILTVLSIIFLIMAMIKLEIDFNQIQDVSWFIGISLAGSLMIMLTVYVMTYAWKIVLENLSGKKLGFLPVVKVYAKSNMGKYLPGNVMHYVERNLFASQMGLGQLEIAAGSIVEIGVMAATAFVFSVTILHKDFIRILQQIISYKMTVIMAVAILLAVLAGGCAVLKSRKAQELVRLILKPDFFLVIGKLILLYLFVLLCYGAVLLLIYQYALGGGMSAKECIFMIAAFVLAWLFGFIVLGAPGGIGIREFVLVLMLSATIGEKNILLAALIHRMICILGDILAYVVTIPIGVKRKTGSTGVNRA